MIVFQNPGLIDLRGLRCFGVNAKQNDNPIGFFGTGLKYAIAGLLRTNHYVVLYRGLERYEFGVKNDQMRGKDFEFITLKHPDGKEEELPFTTELGKTWQDWCFFRELHSNCLDEGGSTERIIDSDGDYFPQKDKTAFLVIGKGIEESFNQRNTIFLNATPVWGDENIDVFHGENKWVYYRGIRAKELNHPSMFTYNLKNLTWGLTEDRTLKDKYDFDLSLSKFMGISAPNEYLAKALVAGKQYVESHIINFCYSSENISETFLETFQDLRKNGHASTLISVANHIYKAKKGSLPLPDPIPLSVIQQKQLDRALDFCKKAGWEVTDYPILVIPHAHGGMLALAEDGKIILTKACFDRGIKEIVAALYEEWTHLKFKLNDETREMQTHLFYQIINLAEQVTGEPL